jgi:hypothetical protein
MREVEYVVEGEDHASLMAAMADTSGSEDTLWSRDVDLGEGHVVELKVCGGGKDGEPWVDVVLFRRNGEALEEAYALDVRDGALGEMVFADIGVTLSVVAAEAPTPSL